MPHVDHIPIPIELPAAAIEHSGGSAHTIAIPLAIPPRERCPPHEADEIVVCAANPETIRLRPLPEKYETKPAKAELSLGENIAAGVELESTGIGGVPVNRVMVRVKIKF